MKPCSVLVEPLEKKTRLHLLPQMLSQGVPLKPWLRPEPRTCFVSVYICYHCGEEFASRDKLHSHRSDCCAPAADGVELQVDTLSEKAGVPERLTHLLQPACISSEQGSHTQGVISSKHTALPISTPLVVSSPSTPSGRVSKPKFLSSLGLLPVQKARRVSERRQSTQCESIDLYDDILPSPAKPRTPKLLISHLSREDGSSSVDTSQSCKRSLFSFQSSQSMKEDGETCSETDGSGRLEDKSNGKERIRHVKSLFNIPITSPLGQCVIKHFKGDPSIHILSDIESHCLTEAPKTNEDTCRLRVRSSTYPITFRGYVKNGDRPYLHKYNFNREDRKEFWRRVHTGLDRESRALARNIKSCKVWLRRLTKADVKLWMSSQNHVTVDVKPLTPLEIMFWVKPKPVSSPNLPAVFPSGLTLSSPNLSKVLGLRTRQEEESRSKHPSQHLSVSNFVSEEVSAELTLNRRAVLKSLLFDSAGGNTSLAALLGEQKTQGAPQQEQSCGYSTLRKLLTVPVAGAREAGTLPDITNLGPDAGHTGKPLRKSFRAEEQASLLQTLADKHGKKPLVDLFQSETYGKKTLVGLLNSKSKERRMLPTTRPLRSSPRLQTSKSTWVRRATEGQQISKSENLDSCLVSAEQSEFPIPAASEPEPDISDNPSSSMPTAKVNGTAEKSLLDRLRSRSTNGRDSNATLNGERGSKLTLNGEENPSSTKVLDEAQQSNRNIFTRMEFIFSRIPSSGDDSSSAAGKIIVKDETLCRKERPHSTSSVNGVDSLPVKNGSICKPPCKLDSPSRRKLASAGLVWRATSSTTAQAGQEQNQRIVMRLDKVRRPNRTFSTKAPSPTSVPAVNSVTLAADKAALAPNKLRSSCSSDIKLEGYEAVLVPSKLKALGSRESDIGGHLRHRLRQNQRSRADWCRFAEGAQPVGLASKCDDLRQVSAHSRESRSSRLRKSLSASSAYTAVKPEAKSAGPVSIVCFGSRKGATFKTKSWA